MKKLYNDFEKARQSHLSIQRDFVNKMQSKLEDIQSVTDIIKSFTGNLFSRCPA